MRFKKAREAGSSSALVRLSPRGWEAFLMRVDGTIDRALRPAIDSPSPEQMSQWLQQIAKGRDEASFTNLYLCLAPKLRRFIRTFRVDPARSDELAHEVMLTVWNKADKFDPNRGAAVVWIFRVARNVVFDELRKPLLPAIYASYDDVSETQTPESKLVLKQIAKLVRDAVDDLPLEQARAIRLSYFDERTHVDISSSLSVPLGTVKSRIRGGSDRLKAELDGLWLGPGAKRASRLDLTATQGPAPPPGDEASDGVAGPHDPFGRP